MPRTVFRSLTIPESLYEQLVQFVEDSQGRYISVTEVVRKAIWEHLEKSEDR